MTLWNKATFQFEEGETEQEAWVNSTHKPLVPGRHLSERRRASNQNIFGAFNQQANQDHCLDQQEEELSKEQKASKTGLKCQKSC